MASEDEPARDTGMYQDGYRDTDPKHRLQRLMSEEAHCEIGPECATDPDKNEQRSF